MTREEKKIMTLTAASHGMVHLYEGVLPPLIPLIMAEFGADYFTLGLVVSVFSYAFGLGSLPAGFFADRVGPKRLVTIYLFGAGILAAGVLGAGSLWTYGVLMGLIGAFCSLYHPASNTLLSLSIAEKGKAFGIHGIAGSLGVAIVPLLSAWIGSALGWRAPHMVYGLVGLAVALYALTIPGGTQAPGLRHADRKAADGRICWPTLVLFFFSAMCLGMTYKGIMTFLPTYMGLKVQSASVNAVAMGGTVATVALISGAFGQYLAGRLADRFAPEKIYLWAVILGGVFVFAMAKASGLVLIGCAVIYAFFYFSTQPTQNYLISRYLPPHRHGIGYGFHFFITFGVGSTAAAGCGYLADRFGLEAVFYAMGGCFVASAAAVTVLVVRKGRDEG